MHRRILRTIDANINRISEGLRVLEDISRFIIEDINSSQQLKSIRHELSKSVGALSLNLLKNRDVEGDIGAKVDLTIDHQNLTSVVRANSKRVEEGLRVLEELAKLPEFKSMLSTAKLKESRYAVYSIEKTLIEQLSLHEKPDTQSREK
ncbi:MAG: thiamine-phosphate pyrophosphorylase [Chloroflexi bacterium]|nr:thiamine-phosphate pyrophosphorylase [Chloroflexota bacterium]